MFATAVLVTLLAATAPGCSIDWSYDRTAVNGPANWGSVREEYDTCRLGEMQTPINLSGGLHEKGTARLILNSDQIRVSVVRKPYQLRIDPLTGGIGRIVSTEGTYEIAQFHFHAPSEHLLGGKSFPAELHFLGMKTGGSEEPGMPVNGDLAVFGFMIAAGNTPNQQLGPIFSAIPKTPIDPELACPSNPALVTLKDLVGEKIMSNTYVGSLTTPPCAEGVRWYFALDPLSISHDQLAQLLTGLPKGGNARPRQRRNGRAIGVRATQ